jgi:ribosomal protein L18
MLHQKEQHHQLIVKITSKLIKIQQINYSITSRMIALTIMSYQLIETILRIDWRQN